MSKQQQQQRSYLGLRGGGLNLAQLFLVVAPAFVLFGYNQACPGGLLSLEDWTHTFPQIATTGPNGSPGKSTLQGFVVAIFALGALFGALSCSWSADRLGRRKTIFLGAVLTLVGEILQCAAFSLAQFVVGRVVLGAGIGMLSAVVPVWQSECSPAKHRGKHVILDGTFISAGFAITSWVNLGFFQIKTGSVPWRLPLAIPIAFSIVAMAAIFFLPESPRWLVRVNRVEEARRTLSALRDTDVDSLDVKREVDGIELSLEETSNNAASMRDIFTMGEDKLFFRFMLCIVLQFFQQMSGGNLISVYSTVIFQENLQLSSQVARILSGGALTWKLLCCAVAFFTVDRFGRRILIMVSGTGMALCMLCLAVATSFPHDNKSASIASVFFIFLFNFFIVLGFLGANWLYATEVAPIRLRIAMASISTANNWLWNFVVTMITPVAIANIGFKYYIIYAVIGICIPVTVYFFYPETMGQNLEELDLVFRESSSIFTVVATARHLPKNALQSHLQATEKGAAFVVAQEEDARPGDTV